MEFMYEKLMHHASCADGHYILDSVLNNLDEIMAQIPVTSSAAATPTGTTTSMNHSTCSYHGSLSSQKSSYGSHSNDTPTSIIHSPSETNSSSTSLNNLSLLPPNDMANYRSSSEYNHHAANISPRGGSSNHHQHHQHHPHSNVIHAISNKSTVYKRYQLENNEKVELKDNIYISKDCTYHLSQYVVEEDWGKDSVLLYKYIDYIFRCQLFNQQLLEIQHTKPNGDSIRYLIFHCGLQRRSDNEFLFVLATPNYALKPQKWRAQIGNIYSSFLSKQELLNKLLSSGIHLASPQYLPQRTQFAQSASDAIYNPACSIEVNWEERLTTIADRLYSIMGRAAFFDEAHKYLRLSSLIRAFEEALSSSKVVITLNPKLVVPQGFVDSKRRRYRMELLLPLAVKFGGHSYTFALAVSPSAQQPQTYSVKSILTLNMGYSNARLVGYVHSSWLVRQK